jgi:thiamine-monophosphate kinase
VKVRDLGERRLIARIRRVFGGPAPGGGLGIGDDAAVVRGPRRLLLTTDLLVEDYDFRKRLTPPRLLGRKSLNVNLSDVAAMGGRPLHAVVGMALPGGMELKWLSEFLAGFREAAEEGGVALVGGDFSGARKVMISVTVTGSAPAFVPRSGARPGDRIFVSGTLGDAAEGLRLLDRGLRPGRDADADRLLKAFLDPKPRLELGALLARRKLASAMIDISDGLSVDLAHICEESGAGAEVELEKIPISKALRRFRKNALAAALDGGEDFELLFTVRPRNVPRVLRLAPRFGLTEIGRIMAGRKLVTLDSSGRKKPLKVRGWEHFK